MEGRNPSGEKGTGGLRSVCPADSRTPEVAGRHLEGKERSVDLSRPAHIQSRSLSSDGAPRNTPPPSGLRG